MTRKALGRGLKALIPDPATEERSPLFEVPVHEIIPNRLQPRHDFDPDKHRELTRSIKFSGVLQPVAVRPADGGKYELIAGERRWRAARAAGLEKIPVIVRTVSDPEALELALIENLQREDLNPIEAALAYQQLVDTFSLTQEEVAARVGKERPSISNHLRLLKLPSEVQAEVSSGRLNMGQARALLSLPSREKQILAAKKIIAHSLSVRETERLVKRLQAPATKPDPGNGEKNIYIEHLEGSLRQALGTKVRIRHRGGKGAIEIQYFSAAELSRLSEHILGKDRL